MSAVPTYRIRDWEKNFMHGDHKRRANGAMTWVRMPTKLDGKSYRRLMRMNPMHYLAWTLIVKVAAKCPEKGLLADDDGPLTAEDLAIKTDAPKDIFDAAFVPLCSVGWLESVGHCPSLSDTCPSLSDTCRTLSDNVPSVSDTVPLTVQYSTVHNNIAATAALEEQKPDVQKPTVRKPTVYGKVWTFLTTGRPEGLGLSADEAGKACKLLRKGDWTAYGLGCLWFCVENPPEHPPPSMAVYARGCMKGRTMALERAELYEIKAAAKLRWFENEVQEETGEFTFGPSEPETE